MEKSIHRNNNSPLERPTGSLDVTGLRKVIIPFDRYEVTVIVNEKNEFVGIEEIKINRNFMSFWQKAADVQFHDIEEFYKEE